MAYVEWHGTIRNHYKTDALMLGLGLERWQAVGVIGTLVAWAIETRPGGVIERKLVRVALEWKGDGKKLVDALIEAGWLDEVDAETVRVHDWKDVTRGYRKARADAARRKRDRREAAEKIERQPPRSERSGTEQNGTRGGEDSSPLGDRGGPDGEDDLELLAMAKKCRLWGKDETKRAALLAWKERIGKADLLVLLQNNRGKSVLEIQKLIEAGGNGADAEPPVRRIKPGEVIK